MKLQNISNSAIYVNGRVIQFTALFLSLSLLYLPVFKKLALDWCMDENYSHGFLIPLISGYLIWKRRKQIKDLDISPNNWGVLVLVFGLLLFILGNIGAELFTMRLSFIFVLSGLVMFILGRKVLQRILFPISFLIFMIPIPYIAYNAIAFPLRLLATKIATATLKLLSIPVLCEGNIIYLPGNTLEVADACSGIRSLITLLALGAVYAYISQRDFWKRAIIVAATIPIAIFANALRLAATSLLSYYVSPDFAQGFFHTFSGWLIFLFAFILLFFLGLFLDKVNK